MRPATGPPCPCCGRALGVLRPPVLRTVSNEQVSRTVDELHTMKRARDKAFRENNSDYIRVYQHAYYLRVTKAKRRESNA